MSSNSKERHDSVPAPAEGPQKQAVIQATQVDSKPRPVIVGLYGLSGCGKTYLLAQLKQELNQDDISFYEGSEVITSVTSGGFAGFHQLKEEGKQASREAAIKKIQRECATTGKSAKNTCESVFTGSDKETYTHILYMDTPEEVIVQYRLRDTERRRPELSVSELHQWQQTEKDELRNICRDNGIFFSLASPIQVPALLRDFRDHNERYNDSLAERQLDEALATYPQPPKTVFVLDADRTLIAEDTGALFWSKVSNSRLSRDVKDTLKTLFSHKNWYYSYAAFRQATLLYEEATDDEQFDDICESVASSVRIHPEFMFLLQAMADHEHVGALVITCWLQRVWKKVLDKAGLSKTVKVIGGGRITDGFVVTPAVKTLLVNRLQTVHRMYVWAFGDSPMDLGMLYKADKAIVVVGDEETRSKTMDFDLGHAIRDGSLTARQALLPSNAPPRLNTDALPLVQLLDKEFIKAILYSRRQDVGIDFHHATSKSAAKILMTPMRDARISGPELRKAHYQVGRHLATDILTNVFGLEEYEIPHAQGHYTTGHRLLDEEQTLIVPLMRGGEPMALGISKAFPFAMFLHANSPKDIESQHLQGRKAIMLVDAVINSGKTMAEFIQRVRELCPTIPIVVVAGVVQAESIRRGSHLYALGAETQFSLVALRRSDNKFTGQGTTDTGNRLFNTTHLS